MPPKFSEKLFYGWVVVLAGVIVALNVSGPRFSFGVFFKPLASEFDLSRTATSSLLSAYMLFCAVFTIAGGWALDRYGARLLFFLMGLFTGLSLLLTSQSGALWQLFISYSLLFSIGSAPLYTALYGTVSKWFDKRRGLASGFAGAGMSLGQIIFAPLAAFLITSFGWRTSFMALGLGVWLIALSASRLIRNDPADIGLLPDGATQAAAPVGKGAKADSRLTGLSLKQALRTRNYWVFMPTWPGIAFSTMMVMTHVVPYATDRGISTIEAATVISMIGVFSIPSGILSGRVSDVIGRKIPGVALALLRVGAMVGLVWARELWMFYLFAIAFGVSNGGLSVLSAAFSVDLFGRRQIGVIIGSLATFHAIGAALGPFIGGLVYDTYHSYTIAFIAAAAASLMIATSMALVRVPGKTGG